MRPNGDIEIRFLNEEELKAWVQAQQDLQINGVHIAVGRKIQQTQVNVERYAVHFFVTGDIELPDVTEELQRFGNIIELTFKTHPNTAIKTGEYTAYVRL